MSTRLAALLSCALFACNPTNSPVGPPEGPGLGASCAGNLKCRTGLTCSSAERCEGSRASPDGASCTLGVECVSGNCAPNGTRGRCAPGGSGARSSPCEGDNDCAPPLKCGYDGQGVLPRCLPAGEKDFGADCTLGLECAQGLLCVSGKCATATLTEVTAPHGVPPVLPPVPGTGWKGASCPASKASGETALWVLPRAGDDASVREDFYRLPFPNDALRDATGRVDFSRHPKEPSPAFGFDLLGRYLDALAPEPFGNAPTVIFRFDGPVSFQSIDLQSSRPNLRLVKLQSGQSFLRGLTAVLNGGANKYVCANWLGVRAFEGESLDAGPWAVVLLKGIQGSNGAELQPSPDFVAMLQAAAPADAELARVWPGYAPLRDYLTAQNIPTSSVLAATVFTVADPQRLTRAVAAAVAARPAPAAGTWVKCGSGAPSPCPDATGPRACGTPNADFEEWHALLELPVYQAGTAPYLTPAQGGAIDPAVTTPVRTEQVCASLTTPTQTPPAGGWPVVLYAHGTGGSFRSHAGDGAALALSSITLPGLSGPTRAAVLGFDQVGHGPRRGVDGQATPPEDIVFNFANPASARGTLAQGAADLHGVTRYLKSLGQTSAPELPPLDVSRVVFWGHSQGATEGALFLARDREVEGALLSGASATLVNAMTSKKAPINLADGLWVALGEARPEYVTTFHPVLSLLQAWSDVVDPLHHAAQASVVPAEQPLPRFTRNVFQVWGKDDLYTAQPVQAAFAMGARLAFVGPQVDTLNITPVVASASGNVMGTPARTAAVRQYLPSGYDGHFVVFNNTSAKADAARFVGRVLRGEVPTIPEP